MEWKIIHWLLLPSLGVVLGWKQQHIPLCSKTSRWCIKGMLIQIDFTDLFGIGMRRCMQFGCLPSDDISLHILYIEHKEFVYKRESDSWFLKEMQWLDWGYFDADKRSWASSFFSCHSGHESKQEFDQGIRGGLHAGNPIFPYWPKSSKCVVSHTWSLLLWWKLAQANEDLQALPFWG